MVAHNPSAAALPLLPLVLSCAAFLKVRFLDRSYFFSIPLIFCNWSSIMVCIRISTPMTHRLMVSVGLATQPGYRVSCRRASAMLYHGCSLIASSLTRQVGSPLVLVSPSTASDTRHATYGCRRRRLTSLQCPQPRHFHRLRHLHANPSRQNSIELFLCSASDPQYSSDSQQTCSFVPCRSHCPCQTGLRTH